MRREKVFTLLRRLLIVALVVSAVLLMLQTDFFSGSQRLAGELQAAAGQSSNASPAEMAAVLRPGTVMVCFSDGGKQASAWDGEQTMQEFRRFSALLGEALGSAGTPEKITEASFRSGLGTGGVFLDFDCAYPLNVLSGWLGTTPGGTDAYSADILFLGVEEDAVSLRFRDENGAFFQCATAVQPETLTSRMAEFQAADAGFAFENSLLAGVDPFLVIPKAMPELWSVSCASARDSVDIDQLAEAMGINSRLVTSYYDADGTLVLNENARTLRLDRSGKLVYRFSGSAKEFSPEDETAAVNAAARVVERSAGRFCGNAEILFSGAKKGGTTGEYTVWFDYCVNGIPVRLPEGHAAEVFLRDGSVARVILTLRRYALADGTETGVLPALQAAAAAAGKGGGTPRLAYLDSGETARCGWVIE